MEENKEFLQGYEIKNWEFSSRIYKILASAAIFNLLFLVVIGQTDLLQTKACNSPLISKVCSVLDTVYVSSKLLSGEEDYVVKDYNKTEIKDADVVWVDNTGVTPQLQYPAGYFQVANRDELAMLESLDSQYGELPPFNSNQLPPITPSSPPPPPPPVNRGGSVFNTKPKLPKRNKNTVVGDLPDDPLGDSDKDDSDKTADNKTDEKTDKTQKEIEDKTAKSSDALSDIEINKKPLQDFADEIVVSWSKKEIDLTQPFMLRMNGVIEKNGRLSIKKSRFVEQKGDEKMINVAKRAIESVGDSGWLDYLSRFEVNKIDMVLAQDQSNLFAVITSELPNPERAKSVATGLRTIIQGALLADKTGFKKLGDDEKKLLNSAEITSEGKLLKINFNMEKPTAQEIMHRKLQEALLKKNKEQQENQTSPKQPNGTTESKVANNATSR